jgi:hypothetical protein|tara:strand:+ start:111 stop:251 length:141 start_codon:yes stop_codon:yes gene_type:complete
MTNNEYNKRKKEIIEYYKYYYCEFIGFNLKCEALDKLDIEYKTKRK